MKHLLYALYGLKHERTAVWFFNCTDIRKKFRRSGQAAALPRPTFITFPPLVLKPFSLLCDVTDRVSLKTSITAFTFLNSSFTNPQFPRCSSQKRIIHYLNECHKCSRLDLKSQESVMCFSDMWNKLYLHVHINNLTKWLLVGADSHVGETVLMV